MSGDTPGEGDKLKFFADAMLGKLARWMRVMGYDVEYDSGIEDDELIKRAVQEERIILTRDTLLLKRRAVRRRSFFVEGNDVSVQLKQVAGRFGIDGALMLTRCLRCNEPLRDLDKTDIRGMVPPFVYETQDRFSKCPVCGRLYWGGTHRKRMLEDLKEMLKK